MKRAFAKKLFQTPFRSNNPLPFLLYMFPVSYCPLFLVDFSLPLSVFPSPFSSLRGAVPVPVPELVSDGQRATVFINTVFGGPAYIHKQQHHRLQCQISSKPPSVTLLF